MKGVQPPRMHCGPQEISLRHARCDGMSSKFSSPAYHLNPDHAITFTFLGTGTSVGVPMIACDCDVCSSTNPRNNRTRCSLYVQTPQASLVVDTGPDFRTQCLREKIREVDAVFFTHEHTDHIMGFDDLRRFTYGEDHDGLPVFALPSTLAALERIYNFAFQPSFARKKFPSYFKPVPKPLFGMVEFGGLRITPLPVEHGAVDTIGFLFARGEEKLFGYISDVKIIPQATVELLRGVHTLVLDCVREKPLPTHFSREEALAAAAEIGPQRTYLTHLCHELEHEAFQAILPPNVFVAYDGLKIAL
jgi:phosphoribosyl 1,2-cyclic phosphate phosphodiesterase